MGLKLSNNAVARLAASITSTETSIGLTPGAGALFPALSAGDWFPATLVKSDGTLEIVKVTARSVDVLTVTRAQESTSASAFNAGDMIELRLTAGTIATIETAATAGVAALQGDVTTLQTDLTALEGTVATLDSTTTADIADLQAQINAIPPAEGLPVGFGPIPWSLPTEPAGWIFADGRTLLSSTTYTALRTAYINASFPFGQDGSGNPKIPDMRGRVPAGKDNMGGTAASRLTTAGSGVDGATLGAAGGAQTHTLTEAQIPSHTHTGSTSSAGAHTHTFTAATSSSNLSRAGEDSGTVIPGSSSTDSAGAHTHTLTINATGGGGAHNNTQPTLITNYIVKV